MRKDIIIPNDAVILVIGPPGVGKGKQGERVQGVFTCLSSGKILEEDPRTAAIVASQQLVATETVLEVVTDHVLNAFSMGKPSWLDGFGRTGPQIEFWHGFCARHSRRMSALIFDVDDHAIVIDRMVTRSQEAKENGKERLDDTGKTPEQLLQGYYRRIGEFIYHRRDIKHQIDALKVPYQVVAAESGIDEVAIQVELALQKLYPQKMTASQS